jgi:RimJ/RimL family protein N-acetyltransferase
MKLSVREMRLDEIGVMPDYFYGLNPEELQNVGVDPTKISARGQVISYCEREMSKPYEQREGIFAIWLDDNEPVGFSSADTIEFGKSAKMHLHVLRPQDRQQGIGTECVRRTVEIYFNVLKLDHLICEPNAFNVGPNRTLQKTGFTYVKTHETVPGHINYHQAVTRWVIERSDLMTP